MAYATNSLAVYGYVVGVDRDSAPGHATIDGTGVGTGVGLGVMVGVAVGLGVGLGDGDGDGESLGEGVGLAVWSSATGESLGTGVGPHAMTSRHKTAAAADRADKRPGPVIRSPPLRTAPPARP
jgi:hypothetical protein